MLRTQITLSCLLISACAGEDGISYLTDINDEPAGGNCTSGGVRIDTGPDDNGNGSLEAGEITKTEYVCATGGVSSLTSVTPEPSGMNCEQGGVKIQVGPDANGNGMLDAAEVTTTNYVCGAGEAQVVKTFMNAGVTANSNGPVTILSASVTTTGPGKVFALGTAETFCTEQQCPGTGTPPADGYMWVANVNNLGVPASEFSYFHLTPNTTESFTRSGNFNVAAAGTHTFYLRGQDDVGAFGFFRSGLTLVFLP